MCQKSYNSHNLHNIYLMLKLYLKYDERMIDMEVKRSIILKRSIVSLVVICIMFSSFAFASVKVSATTEEVNLNSVESKMIDAAAGYTVYGLTAKIKVKNIAYVKKVTLHYKDSLYDRWQDCEAKYEGASNDGYEIWTVTQAFVGDYIQYAIKYEVNGQTYWDNNSGKDYFTFKDGVTIGM